jgi:molybdopterin-guanine dinucleotide biosynthesis protein A
LEKSAIILCDSSSKIFGEDKGLVKLNGKPLLNHVLDAVKGLVEEIIVVANSQTQIELYKKIASPKVEFVIDNAEPKNQLTNALKGFEASHGKYALLLPFDAPFVSRDVVSLLFELSIGKSATVPRYTSCEAEPLQAVYDTSKALEVTQIALTNNEVNMATVVDKMRGVRYISMLVFEQIDSEMKSFFRINSPLDLKKAATMLKPQKSKDKKM